METVLTREQLIAELLSLYRILVSRRPNRDRRQNAVLNDEVFLFHQVLVLSPQTTLQSLLVCLRYLIYSKEGGNPLSSSFDLSAKISRSKEV